MKFLHKKQKLVYLQEIDQEVYQKQCQKKNLFQPFHHHQLKRENHLLIHQKLQIQMKLLINQLQEENQVDKQQLNDQHYKEQEQKKLKMLMKN